MSDETNASSRERTHERLVARECAWCGTAIEIKPRAQHQRYCSRSCRQRAYEVRTAIRRQEDDRATGQAREDRPVREVVEKVTVRTVRPRRAPAWQVGPYAPRPAAPAPAPVERIVEVPVIAAPQSAREAADFISVVAACVADGTIGVYDHKRVYQGVRKLLHAFDRTHPGGLERLMGGR